MKKMHVLTAVETISDSTADSLQFLMEQKIPAFINAGPTIKFDRIFNRGFDVMNTQRVNHDQPNKFKSAINFFNEDDVVSFLIEMKKYIFGLKVKGKRNNKLVPVLASRIKAGFRGFLINIESVISMYRQYVEQQEIMHMIPTYKLSQDHIEMLFCKIRSFHRFNDNPTVQQFKSS